MIYWIFFFFLFGYSDLSLSPYPSPLELSRPFPIVDRAQYSDFSKLQFILGINISLRATYVVYTHDTAKGKHNKNNKDHFEHKLGKFIFQK